MPSSSNEDYCQMGILWDDAGCKATFDMIPEYMDPEYMKYMYEYFDNSYMYFNPEYMIDMNPTMIDTNPTTIGMNPMVDMSDPCAWTQNMEQLCGGDCKGGEKVWCNTYNNDRKKCENAFVRRNTGELGRCESSGS